MPIYEYRCESCGAELEKIQKISDPPLHECPECGKPALVKLISASSFRLKGSGWYERDFKTGKKKNGAAEASAESGSDKGGSAAGAASTDAGTAGATAESGTKKESKDSNKDSKSSSKENSKPAASKPASE